MTIVELKRFLLWSTGLNYVIVTFWFCVFHFAHDRVLALHRRWFKLTAEQFDALNYGGIAIYKIGVLLFNLVPLLALSLMR
jgi:hypothetical protein